MSVEEDVRTLTTTTDRAAAVEAALRLARARRPEAVAALGQALRDPKVLARLDDLADAHTKTRNVRTVLLEVAAHPLPEAEAPLVALADDAAFMAESDRLTPLLMALASLVPMDRPAVEVFRRTNGQGYFPMNLPLLVENGSPGALGLVEEMLLDGGVPVTRRRDCFRRALPPHRIRLGTLLTVERAFDRADEPTRQALAEAMFDYHPKEWFGPARVIPKLAPWTDASCEALEAALRLAAKVREGVKLEPALDGRIARAMTGMRKALEERRAEQAAPGG